MSTRVESEAVDGDVAFLKALIRQGEMLTKVAVINTLALLDGGAGYNVRYATEYRLVRATGVGAWSFELQRLLTGPSKALFRRTANTLVTEMTQRFGANSDSWQAACLEHVTEAERALGIDESHPRTERAAMLAFFTRCSNVRNKFAHGSQRLEQVTAAGLSLSQAMQLVLTNLGLVHLPWYATTQTISGNRRIYPLTDESHELPDELPSDGMFMLLNEAATTLQLVEAAGGASEVYFANGQFNAADSTYEGLSYLTGSHKRQDGSAYTNEPLSLASSESEGLSQLSVQGSSWGNLPPAKEDYVPRVELEGELLQELTDGEVDPIITLGGPGGIGKTSTALQVLHKIAESGQYDLILWFSARDVDLLEAEGAVPVKPKVLTFDDAANSFAHLVSEMGYDVTNPEAAFSSALRDPTDRTLFVFDNFETILEPTALFNILKSHLRLPNKILITTRFTDFKGQYPIDIRGMAFGEFERLVSSTASRLDIVTLLRQTTGYIKSLHQETFGHPYVVKIVLGEIARDNRIPSKVDRILAKRDDILDALFQRSFDRLSPAAQRTFLLLCSWRSVVPLAALEAVQRRSANSENLDVESAVEELSVSSMVEILRPDGKEEPRWINIPAAAFKFGAARVRHHFYSSEVLDDTQYLRLLGPLKTATIDAETLDLSFFFTRAAEAIRSGSLRKDQVLDVALHLAGAVPGAWPVAARALYKAGDYDSAWKALSFGPPELEEWRLADLRVRYETLREKSELHHIPAGLDLLGRHVRDSVDDGYDSLLRQLANALQDPSMALSNADRDRVISEILQAPRRRIGLVSEGTAFALANLAIKLGLRLEQEAWIDHTKHISESRRGERGGVRFSSGRIE